MRHSSYAFIYLLPGSARVGESTYRLAVNRESFNVIVPQKVYPGTIFKYYRYTKESGIVAGARLDAVPFLYALFGS